MIDLSPFIAASRAAADALFASGGNDLVFSRARTFKGHIKRPNVTVPAQTEEDGDPEEIGVVFEVEAAAYGAVEAPDPFEYLGQSYEVVRIDSEAAGGTVLRVFLLCRVIDRP